MTTIFLFDNQAAAATLAASTTASASMGVANLVNPQRSKFHRLSLIHISEPTRPCH
jgi:hypothetical protein